MTIDIEAIKEIMIENQRSILVLAIFILLDIITGVLKAANNSELVSSKFRQGIIKKLFEIILIFVGFCLDYMTEMMFIGNSVSIFFVVMEGYSILENTSEFVELPQILKSVLEQLQGDKNKDDI